MSCSSCSNNRPSIKWQIDSIYDPHRYHIVYKLPSYVPSKLKHHNMDLAYDPCYKDYRLIKRKVKNNCEYLKCSCKYDCDKSICICVKCRKIGRKCCRTKRC